MPSTPPRKDLLVHLGLQPGQRIDVELQAEQATGSITNFIGLLGSKPPQRDRRSRESVAVIRAASLTHTI